MEANAGNRPGALLGAVLLVTAAWGAPAGPDLVEKRLDQDATQAMTRARDPGWIHSGSAAALREAVDRLLALGFHQVRHERYEAAAESFLEARFLCDEQAPESELALRTSEALVRLRRNQGDLQLLIPALESHEQLHARVRPGARGERASLARELAEQYQAVEDAAASRSEPPAR